MSDVIKGKYIDANGRRVVDNTRYPYISGTITVNDIGTNKKAYIESIYPNLTINSVNTPYTQYSVDYVVNGVVVNSVDADVYNNFTSSYNFDGTLPMYPTKDSATILGVQHHYLFDGWVISGSAAASASVDSLGVVSNVRSNLTVTASFIDCVLPAEPHEIPTNGYLYHNTNPSLSAYTLGEFYAICKSNVLDTITTESQTGYFKIGDQIYIQLDDAYSTLSSGYLIFDIIGLKHFRRSIGNGFANIVFACHNVPTTYQWNQDNVNGGGWAESKIRHWLNGYENTNDPYVRYSGNKREEYYFTDSGTNENNQSGNTINTSALLKNYSQSLWGKLPSVLRIMIEKVKVIGNNGNNTTNTSDVSVCDDKLFLFSLYEIFANTANSTAIYAAEVDPDANDAYKSFPFFVNNNTLGHRIKSMAGSSSGQNWWTRTPYHASGSIVWYATNDGYAGNGYNANFSYGAVFGFCI